MNKQGLEELASVMGGRLNFTLDQSTKFDLDNIPEVNASDIEEPLESMDADDEAEIEIAEDATDESRQAD